ncbi:MAG TPA: 50S ribosomal protein L29 [bacterium]|jgi:ribosomal protein L29|nr:50S ribosomal protein L29 [bacterium]
MDIKELQSKSISELHRMLAESREKLRELRFKDANKQLKDVRSIRRERMLAAQILTLINKQS